MGYSLNNILFKDFIKINGLIWMGNAEFMQSQIEEKLEQGFDCIKLKSIFYLFLIFNFLLASFPMSALAYPAYIQDSANLVVVGPYDQATIGVANLGTDMED